MNAGDANAIACEVDTLRRDYKLERAESVACAGLSRFQDDAGLWMARGRVLILAHRLEEALESFKRAEELSTGDDKPVGWQIATLSRQREYDTAIALGAAALARFPGSATIPVALGRVYLDSSRPVAALPYLQEAADRAPDYETAFQLAVRGPRRTVPVGGGGEDRQEGHRPAPGERGDALPAGPDLRR